MKSANFLCLMLDIKIRYGILIIELALKDKEC